jgi:hypothetical protein
MNQQALQAAAQAFLQQNPTFGTQLTTSLGAGYNGVVWLTDTGHVVKITRDREEFQTAQRIMQGANGQFTPKYFAQQALSGGLYALVMEKVEPLKLTAGQSKFLNMFRDRVLGMQDAGQDITQLIPALKQLPDQGLAKILGGLITCLAGLEKLGIVNADIQEDNLAQRGGSIVLLDVVDAALVTESFTPVQKIQRQLRRTMASLLTESALGW